MTAMVLARAFTTSRSADAHTILFCHIWSIAEQDTGVPVMFYHINGTGIESVVADGHCSQALGIFFLTIISPDLMACRTRKILCRSAETTTNHVCTYEPHCRICDLDPYDHLR